MPPTLYAANGLPILLPQKATQGYVTPPPQTKAEYAAVARAAARRRARAMKRMEGKAVWL